MNTDTTKGRIEAGHRIKELREAGKTWKQVEEELGIKPDLGRTLVKEADEYDAKKAAREKAVPSPKDPVVDKAKEVLRNGGESKAPAKARSGRYIKAVCGCNTVIRLSQTALDRSHINCSECGHVFHAG